MKAGDFRARKRLFSTLLARSAFLSAVILFSACSGELQQFLDEDSAMQLSVLSTTTSAPTYSVKNGSLSFTVTLQADRAGSYTVLHGTDCSATRQPAGIAITGSLQKNTSVTISVTVLVTDIATYGSKIVVCVADTANYRSASALVDLSGATTYFDSLNELTGTGLVADVASAFQIFQADATSGVENRGNGVGGPYSASGVNRPYHHAVFIDRNDGKKMKFFVADRNNHRVLIFNSLPTSNAAAADAVLGQTSLTAVSVNAGGGATISAQGFNEPCGVAVMNTGEILIVDRVNNRVLVFSSIPTSLGTWNAYRVIGQPDMASGTANNPALGSSDKQLNDPSSVHVIGGKIYISDRNNHRILVFNGIPAADGASASLAIGQPDLFTLTAGTDYSTSSSYLNHPYEIQKSGNQLFVTDADNNRVLVFNSVPMAADTRPNVVLGQAGPTGGTANRGGSVAANTLNFAVSVAVISGKLAVVDQGNNRVLFYDFPLSNGMAASYVLGQSGPTDFTGSSSGTTASKFNVPKSLVADNGYIWVADQYNHRIQVMQLPF